MQINTLNPTTYTFSRKILDLYSAKSIIFSNNREGTLQKTQVPDKFNPYEFIVIVDTLFNHNAFLFEPDPKLLKNSIGITKEMTSLPAHSTFAIKFTNTERELIYKKVESRRQYCVILQRIINTIYSDTLRQKLTEDVTYYHFLPDNELNTYLATCDYHAIHPNSFHSFKKFYQDLTRTYQMHGKITNNFLHTKALEIINKRREKKIDAQRSLRINNYKKEEAYKKNKALKLNSKQIRDKVHDELNTEKELLNVTNFIEFYNSYRLPVEDSIDILNREHYKKSIFIGPLPLKLSFVGLLKMYYEKPEDMSFFLKNLQEVLDLQDKNKKTSLEITDKTKKSNLVSINKSYDFSNNIKRSLIPKRFRSQESKREKLEHHLSKQLKQYINQIGFYTMMIRDLLKDNKTVSTTEFLMSRDNYIIDYFPEADNIRVDITIIQKPLIKVDFYTIRPSVSDLNRFIALLNEMQHFYYNKLCYANILSIMEINDDQTKKKK